jgi:biopolymer transport protein ExbD
MKIKTHRQALLSLESIALTDIILNIFIFFFTAFSLVYTFNPARESKISLKLPQADIRTPVEKSEPVIINIKSRNEIFLGNRPKTLRELKSDLEAIVARDKERPVIVRADKTVVFDDVVQVLDVAKNAGVERLGIAVQEKPSQPPPKR